MRGLAAYFMRQDGAGVMAIWILLFFVIAVIFAWQEPAMWAVIRGLAIEAKNDFLAKTRSVK